VLSVVEKVIFLQDVDVFSEVTSERLALVAAVAREVDFAAGESIYTVDDASDGMYLVLEGEIRLHRGETEVTVAKSGDAFGTWSLFDDEHRVVSATARLESRLLKIDKDDFIELLADHVELTQAVLKSIVRRLRGLLSRVGG
jgi:CRP-like cAMP-binding protein